MGSLLVEAGEALRGVVRGVGVAVARVVALRRRSWMRFVCVCVRARAHACVHERFQLDLSRCKLAFGCVMHACD